MINSSKYDTHAERRSANAPRRSWVKPTMARVAARNAEEGVVLGADSLILS